MSHAGKMHKRVFARESYGESGRVQGVSANRLSSRWDFALAGGPRQNADRVPARNQALCQGSSDVSGAAT